MAGVAAFGVRADDGRGGFVGAEVALEALRGAMVGEGEAAIGALRDVTAERALEGGGVAAAVEEEEGLLAALEALGDGLFQLERENGRAFFLAGGEAHVNHTDDGHFLVVTRLGRARRRYFPFSTL